MKASVIDLKKVLSLMTLATMLVFMTVATANAEKAKTSSKDEMKLNAEITMLNHDAKLPQGERVLMDQLTKSFDVKTDKIKALRDKNLEYGEIAAVLAFADKMRGGLTDANLNRVADLRQGKTGWSQIAANLKVDLNDVYDKISDIESDAHKNIKKAAAETPVAGAGAGGEGEVEGEVGAGGTDDISRDRGERSDSGDSVTKY